MVEDRMPMNPRETTPSLIKASITKLGVVNGNGESNALGSASARRVHANNLTVEIEQRNRRYCQG